MLLLHVIYLHIVDPTVAVSPDKNSELSVDAVSYQFTSLQSAGAVSDHPQ